MRTGDINKGTARNSPARITSICLTSVAMTAERPIEGPRRGSGEPALHTRGCETLFFNRSKGVVGLDIGSATIKLVELKEKKGGQFTLQRIGVEPLSPEAIVDGSIMDSSLVVDAIQKLTEQTGIKNNNYATSVSGHSCT